MKREAIFIDNNDVAATHVRRRPDEYEISHDDFEVSSTSEKGECLIEFQAGPVKVEGINGIQVEHLLAVCEHRLRFLLGRLPDGHTEEAIKHVEHALRALNDRTTNRIAGNVEGTDNAVHPAFQQNTPRPIS